MNSAEFPPDRQPHWLRSNLTWASYFWLVNAVLLTVIGMAYWPWIDVPESTPLAGIYLLTTHLGLFGLLAVLSACIHVLFAWLPSVAFRPLGGLIAVCMASLLLVDAMVFNQYRFHLDGFVIDLLLEGNDIIALSWVSWLYVAGVIGVLLMLQCFFSSAARWLAVNATSRRYRRRGVGLVAACLLVSQGLHMWEDAHHRPLIPGYTHVFPLYQPVTAKRQLHRLGIGAPYVEGTRLDVPAAKHSALRYPLQPLHGACDTCRPNVLVVVIDSWRHDEMNAGVTPRIAAFAEGAQRYRDHISGGNATQPGIFSLFYSLPVTYWPLVRGGGVAPVLMETMHDKGYAFSIQSSAPLSQPPFDRTVFSRVPELPPRAEGDTPAQRDQHITRRFQHFLQQRDPRTPFFGFLFYDGVHGYSVPDAGTLPFQPSWTRVDHVRLNQRTDPTGYRNLYRNALHHVDALVGQLLGTLQQQGLDDNTIVIITSDHGEEFNDNGQNYWGHGSNFSDVQIKVPLLIRWPGMPGSDVHHRTSHFDVAPTLLADAFASTTPFRAYSVGAHLLDASASRQALIVGSYYNHAVVSGDEISVVQPGGYVRTLAPDLSPRGDRRLPNNQLVAMLEQMSRFHYTSRSSRDDVPQARVSSILPRIHRAEDGQRNPDANAHGTELLRPLQWKSAR